MATGTEGIGPVLVVDAWERMALAACRALGRAGVEVGIGGHEPASDYVAASRYARRYHRLPDPSGPAAPYEAALRDVIRGHGYVAVVSCHDATLARLASIDLGAATISRLNEAWHLVQDKVALADICARLGLAYPLTERIDAKSDVARALARLGAPVFVKSAQSALARPEHVPFQRGAIRAATAEEASHMIERLVDEGLPVIAQAGVEHVEKVNAVLLLHDGHCQLRYAHRVLREHPRAGGMGITLQTISAERGIGGEAAAALEAICLDVGLDGLVQAEFYRGTDGRLYVLDVNPRLWGSTWFAERLGLRVVERSLRAALGLEPLGPIRYPLGRRFHVPNTELKWVLAGESRWRAALSLLADTRPWDVFEYVDRTDPRPNLRWVIHKLRRVSGRA